MVLPLNTITVVGAVTPEVTKTYLQHYINRKPLRHKPTAHISYDLGLHLVRRFVNFSALHTVEELQNFTGQWVPIPHWVKGEHVDIPKANVDNAAHLLQEELGSIGIEQIGGKEWWQWRRDNQSLKAEWIEMRKDWQERKDKNDPGHRVMLYVHGGAYYFGSVDEHRYQIQRHARKLKARCLAPRYRLAPQFPFPCGLHDCLSAYLYLLGEYNSTEIIVAGDSAGGGMVLSMLIVLRNQGIPLPAGGVLISPWVDLMHSFPSLGGDGELDYIPSDGFIHKPSSAWPPPTLEEIKEASLPSGKAAAGSYVKNKPRSVTDMADQKEPAVPVKDMEQGYTISDNETSPARTSLEDTTAYKSAEGDYPPVPSNVTGRSESPGYVPSIEIDGKIVQIRDQIQLYASNHLLTHPLVSPVLQPTLGGLPPLLVQVGGGELLRDEQLYIAHKAADPAAYPTKQEILDKYDPDGIQVRKYPPTDVQVQLWDDMCHVGHTLSWTRPAKFMYRSVAQFGAWALAHAQQKPIDIPVDESDSDSVSSDEEERSAKKNDIMQATSAMSRPTPMIVVPSSGKVGKAGDPLPSFKHHMIRQRVDRHGDIWHLEPIEELPALHLKPEEIGVLKEGPVRKWLARQAKWNKKFASTKRDVQEKRAKQIDLGYVGLPEGEKPPPTALAGRRPKDLPKLQKIKKGYGMMMWSGWGSKHDQVRLQQETKAGPAAEEVVQDDHQEGDERALTAEKDRSRVRSRSRSRSQNVIDEGQAGQLPTARSQTRVKTPPPSSATQNDSLSPETATSPASAAAAIPSVLASATNNVPEGATVVGSTLIPSAQTTTVRPSAGGVAYPFKLRIKDEDDVRSMNASLLTLESEAGIGGLRSSSIASPVETSGVSPPMVEGQGVNGGAVLHDKQLERPHAERFQTAAEYL